MKFILASSKIISKILIHPHSPLSNLYRWYSFSRRDSQFYKPFSMFDPEIFPILSEIRRKIENLTIIRKRLKTGNLSLSTDTSDTYWDFTSSGTLLQFVRLYRTTEHNALLLLSGFLHCKLLSGFADCAATEEAGQTGNKRQLSECLK